MKNNITVITETTTSIMNNGEKIHGNCQPVFCISNGDFFPSMKEAAKKNDVSLASISLVCRGLQKCVKGLKFCLVSDMSSHFVEIAYNMSKLYNENLEKDKALIEMEQSHKESMEALSKVEEDAQTFFKVMSDKFKAIAG